jgi:3-oxoacyl-[acyl-carrier-protein] synthase III
MLKEEVACGIVGIGLYFPENIRTYQDIARLSGIPEEVVLDKLGINHIYYPSEKDQTSEMAVWAAEDCLTITGIDPKEIDLIIYFGENYSDYPLFSIAPKVQGRIGAVNAWCYDMECKCGSAVMSLDQAKKYLVSDSSINTVMIVGGYRNVDKVDYKDRNVSFLFDVSCGGAAAIIKKNSDKRAILENANIADGQFAESIIVPGGGSRTPFTSENIHDDYLKYYRLQDPQSFRDKLAPITIKNLAKVCEMACKKSGLSLSDINFVCPLHMKASAHRELLGYLDLSPDKSFYLSDYGHCGQLDALISMRIAEEKKLIKEGDVVALIAMGFGYVWNAGIVKW